MKLYSSLLIAGLAAASFSSVLEAKTININAGNLSSQKAFPFQTTLAYVDHLISPLASKKPGTGEIHFTSRGANIYSIRLQLMAVKNKVSFRCNGVGIRDFNIQVLPASDAMYVLPIKSVGSNDGGELTFQVTKPSRSQAIDILVATKDPQATWILLNCAMTY